MKKKFGAVVLARMGSSRLPGKVLKSICGKSVLEHVVERLDRVRGLDQTIVATTTNVQDHKIAELCADRGFKFFRGDEDNVLQRTIEAVECFGLDPVVRIGADSPLLDPEVISMMIEGWHSECAKGRSIEYASNTIERSWPIGIDAEIFAAATFRRIDEETRGLGPEERRINEINVVPFLHANIERYNYISFRAEFDLTAHRWTLDTPEDFELISRIYEALYTIKPKFVTSDILELLEAHPDWSAINDNVTPVSGFWTASEKARFDRMHTREECK
ncbi:hypothetical protein C4565_02935 [Candidatus Parcubacteria bacterium]|nr:MAG: hypothetical protein C4565_02935 [Candidatus Parcubacteria bacterium]